MGLELTQTHKPSGDMNDGSKKTRALHSRDVSSFCNSFKRGQVVSLRLRNFVTFDDVFLQASPSLNLIAAPNGTGKSTIASALSIVFCTNLKNLERASTLSEFIKRGEEKATIEVILYDPELPETTYLLKVSRSFDRNRSESFINDKPVRQSEILTLCRSYSIQLDNLCVFLPQERIANFANMDSKELFRRSLEAVGGSNLYMSFTELVSKEDSLMKKKSDREEDECRLVELQKEREQLEHTLRYVEEVRRLENELEQIENVREWLEYDEKRKCLIEISNRKKELKNKKVSREDEWNRLKNELQNTREKLEIRRSELHSLSQETQQRKEKIQFIKNKLDEARQAVFLALQSKKKLLPSFETRRKNIDEKRENIKSLERRLSEHISLEDLEEQLKEKRDGVFIMKNESDNEQQILLSKKKVYERAKIELQSQMQEMQELENQRARQLKYLEERNPGLQHAMKVIEQNSHKLRGKVWGPIGLEIHTHDEYSAKILQACVPNSLRRMFVVEFDDDFKILTESILKDFPFDCVSIERIPQERIVTPSNLDSLSIYGLHNVVTNIFDAPREIKLAMCSHTPYSSMYVGDEKAQEHTEEIIQKTNVRHWYNPEECFRVVISRFTNEKILQRDPLRPLLKNALMNNQESRQKDISTKINRLSKEIRDIEEEISSKNRKIEQLEESIRKEETYLTTISSERNEVFKLLSERKRLISQVEQEESELGKLNFHEEHLKMQETIERHRKEILFNLKELKELLNECVKKEKLLDQIVISCVNLSNTLKSQESEECEKRDEFLVAENEYIATKNEYLSKKNELATKYKELQEKAPMEEYRTIVQGYPQDLNSLNNVYNKKKARLTAISNVDSSTLSMYEKVQRELAEVEVRLKNTTNALHEEENLFSTEKDRFLEEIRNHVASMSARFSQLFSLLECRGELVLKQFEELKNLSIEILVSFRDDQPLLPLSGSRNSGGEKMVSIMLYIFSMQHLTKAPFRLVDEMNQGMDPWFERKIISLMIRNARESSSSQVFLISPKLLTGLEFGKETRVHFIFNGPCVSSKQDSWSQLLSKDTEPGL